MNFSPVLTGRRVRLEALGLRHLPSLLNIATSPGLRGKWPLRGRTVHPLEFGDLLYAGGSLGFAIVRIDNEDIVGLALASDLDLRSGTGTASIMLEENLWLAGWPFEAMLLIINFLFDFIGLRRLYFQVPDYNLPKLGRGIAGWAKPEGTLSSHRYVDGSYINIHLLSLDAGAWDFELVGRITGRTSMTPP